MNNNNNSRLRPRQRRLQPRQSSSIPLLRDIRESLQHQQNTFTPSTKDIQFPRVKPNKIYTLELSYSTTWSSSSTVETDFGLAPNLGAVADAASYAACFDTYRIIAANVKFTPEFGAGVNSGSGVFMTAIDYDNVTGATSTAITQYDTLMVSPLGQIFERSFVPRVAQALYGGSVFSSFGQAPPLQWVDCANTGVPHYGLIGSLPQTGGSSYTYFVLVTIIVQFKNTR